MIGVLISKYYYDFITHSKQPWPFDASMYWYSMGIFLYIAGDIAAYLPKSILVSFCIVTYYFILYLYLFVEKEA